MYFLNNFYVLFYFIYINIFIHLKYITLYTYTKKIFELLILIFIILYLYLSLFFLIVNFFTITMVDFYLPLFKHNTKEHQKI